MPRSKTKLTIGRGRLYFDPFYPGTQKLSGERYIGNTPAFNVTRSTETVIRTRSLGGRKISDKPVIISEQYSASFTTDNISYFNLSNWFGGDPEERILSSSVTRRTYFADRSKIYDLGVDEGLSYRIARVEAFLHDQTISVETNFDLSAYRFGRITILENATDVYDGSPFTIIVYCDESRDVIVEASGRVIAGALRYQSYNAYGENTEYLYPSVTLTCTGGLDLKSESFQQVTFDVQIYKLNALTPFQYLRILPELSENDRAVISTDLTLKTFAGFENRLDNCVQFRLLKATTVSKFHNI